MENLFIKGTRKNVTFTELGGVLTISDVWDLPLLTKASHGKCLDTLYLALEEKVSAANAGQGKSLIRKTVKTDEVLDLKFGIVNYIIVVKMAEEEAAVQAQKTREQKQQILSLIAQKENEQLAGTSLEDLRRMFEAL